MNVTYNIDCMEYMKSCRDKQFNLAIVDPPYGGGHNESSGDQDYELKGGEINWENRPAGRFRSGKGSLFAKYTIGANRTGGTWAEKYGMKITHWDIAPPAEFFQELARVSKNQIIWGGNYFYLPPTRCFLVWRKLQIPLSGFSMAPCEYAWTSFNRNAAMYECFSSGGSGREARFHPTQKPISLYEWLLTSFAVAGDLILDTHLGSGSSRIAAYNLGFDFVGCEINSEYFSAEEERYAAHAAQENLFI